MSQIIVSSPSSLLPIDISDLNGATEHALVIGDADNSLISLGVAGNGELPIGSVGADPVITTLTEGANITITNAPGSITIAATGGGIGPEFSDDVFRVYDDGDNTKKIALEVDQVTTGTTRTLTMCDQDLSLITPSFPGTVTTGGNIGMPVTNAAFTEGVWTVGGQLFMHNLGTRNTFFGDTAGSLLNTGTDNTSLGYNSLTDINDGDFNVAIGSLAGENITDGSGNVCLGMDALDNITTGSENIGIGFNAGTNLTATDSDNIIIGNTGVVGDNNKIRIGAQGVGSGQQNNTFIAGIYGVTPIGGTQSVIINNNGELGTTAAIPSSITDHSLIVGSGAGAVTELGVAGNGEIPIGSVGADPVLATITEGANITVTNGAGSITIASTGHETWNEIAGTTQNAEINNGYVSTNAAQTDIVLPAVAAFGSTIKILGNGAGGWKLSQNASQYIRINELEITTVGLAGFIRSTDDYDSIELVCTTANNGWTVFNSKGNLYYE